VVYLVLGHIADLLVGIDVHAMEKALRASPADAVNISESDLSSFFRRKIDARDTCHVFPLPLPLLMFRVNANDPHHALAVDQFAFVANLFD
jgi:hypothetical protein